ncbi:MAG: hypothetical protein LBU58_02100 [Clostridiales bacterium]|nr:hypothetical protein [Clostridiales bacterium]
MRKTTKAPERGFRRGLARAADRLSKVAVTAAIAASVLFGSFMAYSSYSDSAVKGYLDKAERFLTAADYQKASEYYSKYLKKNPGDKTALIGILAAGAGETGGAASAGGAEIGGGTGESARSLALSAAYELLSSDTLIAADFPEFTGFCQKLGDRALNVEAYNQWLRISPGHVGAMIELASQYIADGTLDPALEIAQSLIESEQKGVAAVLLGQAAGRAGEASPPLPPERLVSLCELWLRTDEQNLEARLALASAYAASGAAEKAEAAYRYVLGKEPQNTAAYDGLLAILYSGERLRDRFDLLEAAVRNVGSQKYRDMLAASREKLAEYYSVIREGGVVYRDGIFKISRLDRDGVEITSDDASAISPDDTSYRIEFYDRIGDVKEMFIDSERIKAQIADIDYDGIREVLIRRYVAEGLDGVSDDAVRSVVWYDIYRLDRDLNKLIYATPDYPNYYKNTYVPSLNTKLAQFERLSEAMEGHYGVTYGLLYALRQTALDFAGGAWTPGGAGDALRDRLSEVLIVPDLAKFVEYKNTLFGKDAGDFRIRNDGAGGAADDGEGVGDGGDAGDGTASGGDADSDTVSGTAGGGGDIFPGMTEAAVTELLGPPRHITEEAFNAQLPDGTNAVLTNRILEYTGVNLYTSDGAVKALRVNARDFAGPRALRIGDTVRDIINKFPASYFDDVANYPAQKANADIELTDTERGIVLNYTVKNGIILNIELFVRDASGDWKPGTNLETQTTGGSAAGSGSAAGANTNGGGADAAGETDQRPTTAATGAADSGSVAFQGTDGGDADAEAAPADSAGTTNVPSTTEAAGAGGAASTSPAADTEVTPPADGAAGTSNMPPTTETADAGGADVPASTQPVEAVG